MLWLFPNPNANQCDQLSWNYIQFIYICEISASSQRFDCNATSTNDVSHHAYLVWVTLLLTWHALCSTLCCNLSNSTQIWASPQSTLKDGNYPQAVLRRQPWGILSWYLRYQGGVATLYVLNGGTWPPTPWLATLCTTFQVWYSRFTTWTVGGASHLLTSNPWYSIPMGTSQQCHSHAADYLSGSQWMWIEQWGHADSITLMCSSLTFDIQYIWHWWIQHSYVASQVLHWKPWWVTGEP